jgi:hypothetical protein
MRGAETAGEEPERYARPEADKREDTHGLVQPPQFHTGYTVHSTVQCPGGSRDLCSTPQGNVHAHHRVSNSDRAVC